MRRIILVIIIIALCYNISFAACTGSSPTWYCTTETCPTQDEVNACITGATSGDTINIASGTYTWTAAVIIPNGKTITLMGEYSRISETGTIIDISATEEINAIVNYAAGSRISHFKFIFTSDDSKPCILLYNSGWRFDNNYIVDIGSEYGAAIDTGSNATYTMQSTGVIDNNTIDYAVIHVQGPSFPASLGYAAWYEPSVIGTGNAVFVEDNILTTSPSSGGQPWGNSNYSGRYVFRYNNILDPGDRGGMLETHGLQDPLVRSSKSWEIYGNYFDAHSTAPIKLRGGTGLVFANKMDGLTTTNLNNNVGVFMDYQRTYNTYGTETTHSLKCDGSSLWDGNEAIDSLTTTTYGTRLGTGTHTASNGETLIDTVTSGTWATDALIGITVWNMSDTGAKCVITDNNETSVTCSLSGGAINEWRTGDSYKITNGYPCREQIGRGSDSALFNTTTFAPSTSEPAYYWSNRNTGLYASGGNQNIPPKETDIHLIENRDYYSYNGSFDGTSGVGCGTNRPETCTAGVAYWATDQSCSDLTGMVGANPSTPISGTLYKCTATNKWTAYYTPYEYPHPLRGESEADTTAPTVTISTSNSTITSDSLTVTGTSVDAVGVSGCKFRIGSAPDASNGTTCTGTTSFSCATAGYSSGSNTIYVGCYDAAGNYGSDSITVTFIPPTISGGISISGGSIQ